MIRYINCDPALKQRIAAQWSGIAPKHWHLDDGFTLVAVDETEAIIGFISVYPRNLFPPVEHCTEGFIDIIEVIPSHRRRGIARELLSRAAIKASEIGCCQLSAWSSEDKTEAILMWKALGFALFPTSILSAKTNAPVNGYRVALALKPS